MPTYDYPIHSIPIDCVSIEDPFWSPKLKINSRVTIWSILRKCEETGRIANFEKAAGLAPGPFVGLRFNDSDVYKIIEAAAYSLQDFPDPVLLRYIDSILGLIISAQWPDGYLNTFYSLGPEEEKIDSRFPADAQRKGMRWTNLRHMHELYCAGHFIEASIAYYEAKRKKQILDSACRLADHLVATFGWDRNRGTPGHEEVELALCKLYRVTGNERYLNLAKYFIDQRGKREGRAEPDYGEYAQDHKPVIEQDEAVGHAVRAGYLYAGITELAALTGDKNYAEAIDRIWENIVSKKYYITGGIGAKIEGESFGGNYELPNKTAYNETCAAIANMFWSHRMFLLRGESKYIDVLERALYNGFLSGVSIEGDEFFYSNPLETDGKTKFNRGYTNRSPWFDCSCCPPNIARLLASLSGYIYAKSDDTLFVNLFIGSKISTILNHLPIKLTLKTNFPWSGKVNIKVETESSSKFRLAVRVPCWARNSPVPSDLYSYVKHGSSGFTIRVNGKKAKIRMEKGYAVIYRKWNWEDKIEIDLPIEVRRVVANSNVKDDQGKVAIERGPIVFCAEEVDNNGYLKNLIIADDVNLEYGFHGELLGGVGVITGPVKVTVREHGTNMQKERDLKMIPYFAWSNRYLGAMKVWLERAPEKK